MSSVRRAGGGGVSDRHRPFPRIVPSKIKPIKRPTPRKREKGEPTGPVVIPNRRG